MTGAELLRVRDLRVSFDTPAGRVDAVRGIDFTVGREKVGIVGESGSGKSMTGRAIMRLLPGNAILSAGELALADVDLLRVGERTLQGVRGRRIALIMQDPRHALNPVRRVGLQIAEAYRVHHAASASRAKLKALELLAAVRIRDPERVYGLYPHEVSGGMGQRVMIAMMLAPGPELIIADEPTSALDVTVRLQVLAILDDLVTQRGIGLIFISHDLNLVGSFCDRVLIMYAGRIVETCRAANLKDARHPYTRGLLASLPDVRSRGQRLAVLERDPAWARETRP
jgi:peptide/nickel transport system ATP-binding protein